jgi:hypothetical protein
MRQPAFAFASALAEDKRPRMLAHSLGECAAIEAVNPRESPTSPLGN